MKLDLYEEVTNRIIKQLEEGIIPWHKPWKVAGFYLDGKLDVS